MTAAARVAAACAVVAAAAALGAFDLYDFDLGLARVTGRWIVEHAAVPETNVVSTVSAAHPFVDDKWLFHVLAYAVVDGLGATAAVLLRIVVVAALALVLLTTPPPGSAPARAFAAPAALLALVACNERFAFRPELFTLLFTAWFARVLLAEREPGRGQVVALLALQVLWTNLHGYFVLGPILAGASVAGAAVDGLVRREGFGDAARRLGLAAGLVLVSLVNPYGVRLVLSPVHVLADLQDHFDVFSRTIVEFAPTFAHQPVLPSDLAAYRALLVLVMLALVVANRRVRAVELVPLAALFVMSLEIRRNVAPFAVVAAPLAAVWLARGIAAWPERARAAGERAAAGLALAAVPAAALVVWLHVTGWLPVHDRLDKRFGFGESAIAYPDAETGFVLDELPRGVLFNSFSFGSYFTGRAFPERTAFIDGNTAGYAPEFLADYAEFVQARGDPAAFMAHHGIDQFLIKPGHPLAAWLLARKEPESWAPVFLGRQGVVIVKDDARHRAIVERFDLRSAPVPEIVTPRSTATRATFPTAELNRARLLLALGRVEEALRAFDTAAAVNDALYEPWMERGIAALGAGDDAAALASLDAAIARAPSAAVPRSHRGLVLWKAGRFGEALEELLRAAALDPDDALVQFRIALALRDTGDRAGALAHVRRSLDLDPGHAPAQELLQELGG